MEFVKAESPRSKKKLEDEGSMANKDCGAAEAHRSRKRSHPSGDDPQICKYMKQGSSQNKSQMNEDSEDGCSVSKREACWENVAHCKTTIDDLPDSLMVRILGCLPLHSLLLAGRVCKQWHRLTQDPDLWRRISLQASWQSKVNDEILARLCSYSSNVTSLSAPSLKGGMVTASGMRAALQQCPNLQSLTLACSMELELAALDAIGEHCRKLVNVDLSCCFNMNDNVLIKMAERCELLENVSLSQCPSLTAEGIKSLAQGCPRLKVLKLKHNVKVSDDAIKTICEKCREVEELYLTRCDVTSACLEHIAKLPNLRVLEVGSLGPVRASEICPVVKNCTQLSNLNLSLCQTVDDSCVEVIVKHAKQLKSLYLVSCSITDQSLSNIAKSCKNLETLDIGWCKAVTDTGVRNLCRFCPTLKYLGLIRCDAVTNRTAYALTKVYPRCSISTVWLDYNRLLERANQKVEESQDSPESLERLLS